MNIYMSCVLFALVILIYWVVIDFFTMLFRFTGLPDEKARFQVMSLLTGCGFTTDESEMILAYKVRRRLARITLLFGYAFNITIVSAFINVFISLKDVQKVNLILGVFVPLGVFVLVIMLLRVPKVRAWEDHIFTLLAGRILHRTSANSVLLIDYIGEDAIAQVYLREVPENLRDRTLEDTGLKAEQNIMVMLVGRQDKKAEAPTAKTIFQAGDILTVFGDYKAVCSAFDAREQYTDLE